MSTEKASQDKAVALDKTLPFLEGCGPCPGHPGHLIGNQRQVSIKNRQRTPGVHPGVNALQCILPVLEAFSSVPRLPAWSFLRLICGGVLPPPHSPDKSGAAVSPADKS